MWKICASLSELEDRRGNAGEARNLHEEARTIVEYIASHTPSEWRASFLNLPQVRFVLEAAV